MNNKKWVLNKKGIVSSLAKVIKTKDISNLSKDAYNFTMNVDGFIAHYNIEGFKYEYSNVAHLVEGLQNSMDIKDADRYINDRYFSEGNQSEYYKAKSETLNAIKDLIEA